MKDLLNKCWNHEYLIFLVFIMTFGLFCSNMAMGQTLLVSTILNCGLTSCVTCFLTLVLLVKKPPNFTLKTNFPSEKITISLL